MRVSPVGANGFDGCSPAQIGLGTTDEPTCPDASKIGSATIATPLLSQPLTGSVYLATPNDNPFGSPLAIYLVAEGPGLIVKLPWEVQEDPDTGELTASVRRLPAAAALEPASGALRRAACVDDVAGRVRDLHDVRAGGVVERDRGRVGVELRGE